MTAEECIKMLMERVRVANLKPPFYILSGIPVDISAYPDIVENQVSAYMPKDQLVIQELKYKKEWLSKEVIKKYKL